MAATMVRVWDPVVRILHWVLAVAYFVAYFTEGDLITVHLAAGYIVLAVVGARTLWGVVGTKHARFTDFIYKPSTVIDYLKNLARLRGRRYLGHSPAGGAMTVFLLVYLAVLCWAGIEADTGAGRIYKEIHESLGGLSIVVVLLHIAGVALASFVHRENLPRAMVTGDKRPD